MRGNLKIITAVYGVILALAFSGCNLSDTPKEWALEAGDRLPYFEVTTLQGSKVGSNESYTRELIIVFFNTSCKDCRRELPRLQQEYEENLALPESQRSEYICISREEGAGEVAQYWKEAHLTLPVAADETRTLYSLFASMGIPRFFKARNGIIIESMAP